MTKPLIVAVEPDPQQASELASMFQRQFTVELVLANSATGALSKLAEPCSRARAHISADPAEGRSGADRLAPGAGHRGLHVQTVTIPTLATDEPQSRPRRRSCFGRERPAAGPDSCDPAVFADWISVYLDLASTHRAEAKAASRNDARRLAPRYLLAPVAIKT